MRRTTGSWAATPSPLARQLADWLELSPGHRAVDVGCGPGALTGVLVEALGADHVAAIDPSAPFVEAVPRPVPRRRRPAGRRRVAPVRRRPLRRRGRVPGRALHVRPGPRPHRDGTGDPQRRLGRRHRLGPGRLARPDGAAVGGRRRGRARATRRERPSRAARATSLVAIFEAAGLARRRVGRAARSPSPTRRSRSGGSPTSTASDRPARPSPPSSPTRRARLEETLRRNLGAGPVRPHRGGVRRPRPRLTAYVSRSGPAATAIRRGARRSPSGSGRVSVVGTDGLLGHSAASGGLLVQ